MIKKWIVFFICILMVVFTNSLDVSGEGNTGGSRVTLSPPYMDLGSISGETKSFAAVVMNEGKSVNLKVKIDNTGNAHIKVTPDHFLLGAGESKKITITLQNDDSIKTGLYDLSIAYLSYKEDKKSITAYGTNSLRLVFRKEGLALASCNVKDIAPVQITPFYSILSNFYSTKKTVDVDINIKSKQTENTVWHQNNRITINAYPASGSYEKIETPLPSEPWQYGDYIYSLRALDQSGVLLNYQTEFNVGEMKGILERVETKNVRKGTPAHFNAVIRNVGTQNLPVKVQIKVKDSSGTEIYTAEKADTISQGKVNNYLFTWPTKYTNAGKYSIDYIINMGKDQKTGTLYYLVEKSCIWFWIIVGLLMIVLLIFFLILIIQCRKRHKCRA